MMKFFNSNFLDKIRKMLSNKRFEAKKSPTSRNPGFSKKRGIVIIDSNETYLLQDRKRRAEEEAEKEALPHKI